MLSPTKPTLTEIAKHPVVYAMVVIALTGGYFVHRFDGTSNQRHKDCIEQVNYLRQEIDKERQDNRNLQMELLIKNNIINSVPDIVDSLAKDKIRER